VWYFSQYKNNREVCKEIFSFKECGDGDFVYVRRPKPHVDGKWLGTKGKWPKLGMNMQKSGQETSKLVTGGVG